MTSRLSRLGRPPLLAAALLAAAASANAQTTTVNAHAQTPHGVQFGFWENHDYQAQTLARYGRRPTARIGIDAWNSIENTKLDAQGNLPPPHYNWTSYDQNALVDLQRTHQSGESAMVAVNVSFTTLVSNKLTIPSVYKPDITDPTTRARALAFVQEYVKHLATAAGSFTLTIDYEINDNYKLISREHDATDCSVHWYDCRDGRARVWGDWYAEAAQAARDAMAAYNASRPAGVAAAVLTVQPIMNSDVSDPANAMNSGDNAWWAKVVGASDQIAFDTYHCVAGAPVTDPTRTLQNMLAWGNLAWGVDRTKNLVVTENGFSSGLSTTPAAPATLCGTNNGKYVGTESEQQAYFSNLFGQLRTALTGSGPYGALTGRVKAFHIWSIVNNPLVTDLGNTDHYFGMLQGPIDSKPFADKPAAPTVYDGIVNQFESSSALTPMGTTVGATLVAGMPLTFTNGTDHNFLAYKGPKFVNSPSLCTASLSLADARAGDTVLLRVNSTNKWISKPATVGGSTDIALAAADCNPGNQNMLQLEVYVTGPYFPMTRRVNSLSVHKT